MADNNIPKKLNETFEENAAMNNLITAAVRNSPISLSDSTDY
jgi:hypothetical protein